MDWFNIFVSFGIIQGAACSILLALRRPLPLSNRMLIALLLTFAAISFKILLHTLSLWETPMFRYFPLGIDLLIQPVLYFYVLSLTRPHFRITAKEIRHFILPSFFLSYALLVYFLVVGESSSPVKDQMADALFFNAVKSVEDYLSVLSAIFYGRLMFLEVQRYRTWLENNISSGSYDTLKWLQRLLWLTGVLALVLGFNIIADRFFESGLPFMYWQVFYIYLSAAVYFLAMRGYARVSANYTSSSDFSEAQVSVQKFSDTDLASAYQQVMQVLNGKKLFRDSELTLGKLSTELGLSPALVSAAINRNTDQGFRTLVNKLRVEEVKLGLNDPRYKHLSLFGLALEAGFNSEPSFYRIFKSETGFSPGDWARRRSKVA